MLLLCFNEHNPNMVGVTPTAPELLAMSCTEPGLTGQKYEFSCQASFCFWKPSRCNSHHIDIHK